MGWLVGNCRSDDSWLQLLGKMLADGAILFRAVRLSTNDFKLYRICSSHSIEKYRFLRSCLSGAGLVTVVAGKTVAAFHQVSRTRLPVGVLLRIEAGEPDNASEHGLCNVAVGGGEFMGWAEMPLTEMPLTEMPVTKMPVTEMPVTEMPATEMPSAMMAGKRCQPMHPRWPQREEYPECAGKQARPEQPSRGLGQATEFRPVKSRHGKEGLERAIRRIRHVQRSDEWNLSYEFDMCQIRTWLDRSAKGRELTPNAESGPNIRAFQLDPEAQRNKDGIRDVMLNGHSVYGLASRWSLPPPFPCTAVCSERSAIPAR